MPRDISNHPDALRIARQPDDPRQLYFPFGGPLLHRPSQYDLDREWAERSNYGYIDSGERGDE